MSAPITRPIILGRLVELWVRSARTGELVDVAPAGRHLLFRPVGRRQGWGRLELVSITRRSAAAPGAADERAAQMWSWGGEGEMVWVRSLHQAVAGQRVGPVVSVVYRTEKGQEEAEWQHVFSLPPIVRQQRAGLITISGPVHCTEAGIDS